jgi:hypothetical protein
MPPKLASPVKLLGILNDVLPVGELINGVTVLGRHPGAKPSSTNIDKTQDMHAAARELLQDGFAAWIMSHVID